MKNDSYYIGYFPSCFSRLCRTKKGLQMISFRRILINAVAQETLQTDIIEKSGKILNPRTINKGW